jgi:plasmid stabilization system protein ParE
MQIKFLAIAQIELDDSIEYYNRQVRGLGHQFLDEIIKALDLIAKHPEAWPQISERTRRCQINRFPYGLIYQKRNNEILIIAVSHLHRKPEYWQERI